MKNTITLFAAFSMLISVFAQSPEKMSYQAVIRDTGGSLLTNTQVGMRISILQGAANGTAVYTETQTPTTNANGLVSIEIGTGVTNDSFSAVDWANGPYYIKRETDLAGATNYTIVGTSQLLSVPYALHAKTAENITGSITETDPSVPVGTEAGEMQYWNGTAWVTVAPTIEDGATLQMIGGIPQWVGGGMTIPDAPIIGTAVEGNGQATVPFTAPANDGGSPITYYTAISSPGNITATLTQSGSGIITVTGLTNGTAYTFTVTATNAVGVSSPSNNSNSVTPFSALPSVTNPATGKTWMDRNLGASRAAISIDDTDSYGDLYQWGRAADGHEKRNSGVSSTLSTTDAPGNGYFIAPSSGNYDWRSSSNNNLWQGVNGINNPCPSAYRLPTQAEWEVERQSWSSNNASGAFSSPLKLPSAGYRYFNGVIYNNSPSYWSSSVNGTYSYCLNLDGMMGAEVTWYYRASGYSVRCIKD